ncbi:MAG: hypothetical protein DBY38_06555 [Clostridium cadaveris]|uniref:Uncharacterized protein n=1 Tax=Clostridium cadaveris TaxID=1529 RepID=A0A316M6F7_9CLOT|nr:MAG: hypothetical protein DBY38_06555 [Clostridium cadaveris]
MNSSIPLIKSFFKGISTSTNIKNFFS